MEKEMQSNGRGGGLNKIKIKQLIFRARAQ